MKDVPVVDQPRFVPLTTLTMGPIPTQEMGYATSLYSVVRNIGSSMGISFVTTWIARRSQFHQNLLSSHVTPCNPTTRQLLGHLTQLMQQRGFDPVTAGNKAHAVLYQMLQQQASLLSYVDVFYIMGILFLAVIALVLPHA